MLVWRGSCFVEHSSFKWNASLFIVNIFLGLADKFLLHCWQTSALHVWGKLLKTRKQGKNTLSKASISLLVLMMILCDLTMSLGICALSVVDITYLVPNLKLNVRQIPLLTCMGIFSKFNPDGFSFVIIQIFLQRMAYMFHNGYVVSESHQHMEVFPTANFDPYNQSLWK